MLDDSYKRPAHCRGECGHSDGTGTRVQFVKTAEAFLSTSVATQAAHESRCNLRKRLQQAPEGKDCHPGRAGVKVQLANRPYALLMQKAATQAAQESSCSSINGHQSSSVREPPHETLAQLRGAKGR